MVSAPEPFVMIQRLTFDSGLATATFTFTHLLSCLQKVSDVIQAGTAGRCPWDDYNLDTALRPSESGSPDLGMFSALT